MGIFNKIIKNVAIPAINHVKYSDGNLVPIEILIEKHQVLPDATKDPPHRLCDVLWEKTRVKAKVGNTEEASKMVDEPCVQWISEVDKYYTVMMLDLDMPHRSTPSMRHFIHWMVTNIKGPNVHAGQPLVQYIGPVPPKHTGLHRIAILVYGQGDEQSFSEKCITTKMGKQRANFNVEKFVQKYNLYGPLGINYLMTEHDEDVDDLLEQIGLLHLNQKKKDKNKDC